MARPDANLHLPVIKTATKPIATAHPEPANLPHPRNKKKFCASARISPELSKAR
jgi:hypothetical protein